MNNSIIDNLDFESFAIDCKSLDIQLFDAKKHGIVKVYSNENQPALFLKEVEKFDFETSKQIAEIQHICWNFQKVLFLYVYTKTEIRIYNCSSKPFVLEENITEINLKKELKKLEIHTCLETDKEKLNILNIVFSRLAVDTGFIWSSEEAVAIRQKINLQKRVDKYLIQSLEKAAKELESEGLTNKLIVHKLVMRSLFLLYLEDRKATSIEFYESILPNTTSYFDILENVNATYQLFETLADDFNGSLFNLEENEQNFVNKKHLSILKKCFFDGKINDSQKQLFNWRLFDFSIIRIELLSEIYENFLNLIDKRVSGTFYTPPSLVDLILKETLPENEENYYVKILDPSCGSGIFLVQSFKKLIKRYEKKEKKLLTDFVILKEILLNNIFGIEIDSKAIKVAAFSLYLVLLENLDPKTGWWNKTIQFPYLINDPEDKTLKQQGNNLFKRDTISDLSEIKNLQNFDLVVGNPPFGTKELTQTITSYCVKEKFAKEMVLPFLHKATTFAPNGKIALIFNTKVLTNTGGTYQNFRHWLFNKNYVEKIYNFSILRKAPKFSGGQLFGSATEPICIMFFQKEKIEDKKDTITYYTPKTYIKNYILDGIVIDSSDVKYLPRIECKKKDTKIWKIAMWGSYFDFELIEKINSTFGSLKDFIKENNEIWDCSTGIMADSLKLEFIPEKLIHTQSISRYYTSHKAVISNDKLYRKINEKFIKAPYLLVKEGQENKKYCSSIIENTKYFLNSAFGFSNSGDFRNSKLLCAYINSTFTSYFLSIYTSSWGIERERIKLNELLLLPAIIKNLDYYILENISSLIDQIISIKKSNELTQDINHLENEIDQIIYNDILKLTEDEQIIIQDTLNFSLDLFEKQTKSQAMFHVENCADYLNRLTKELNDWLEDVDLKISITTYFINRSCPLYMVKISFGTEQNPIIESKENVYNELKRLDRCLWAEESQHLYFRKKLNYYDGNNVYIIKPNQRRFWSQTAAMEDSNALLVDILKMKS